jgi:hypothetical protein
VYKITKKNGLIAGMKAFSYRTKICTPNHSFIHLNNKIVLIAENKELFQKEDLNQYILKENQCQ